MGGIDNTKIEHYGLVDAEIDADLREVRLTVKRGKRELHYEMEVGVKRGYDSEFSL